MTNNSFSLTDLYPKYVINSKGEKKKFDESNIAKVLNKETGLDMHIAEKVAEDVIRKIIGLGIDEITTNYIRELVCVELTQRGLNKYRNLLARAINLENISFKLNETFIEDYKGKQPSFGPLGYITYKRTYARIIEDENRKEEFWETIRRVVEGCYSIQKEHCIKLSLPWSDAKAQKSAQTMFKKIWDFKFLPPGRGLWMMGTEFIARHGSMSLNNCFAAETEVITREGIKKLGDLVDTTQILLSKNGKWIEAPVKSFGKQKLVKLTVKRNKEKKNIFCTPDHRWFAKSRKIGHRNKGNFECKTSELEEFYNLAYMFSRNIGSPDLRPSPIGIARGISFGDGTMNHLYLCGEKDKELQKYFPLNEKTFDPNKCEGGAIRISNLPRYWKTFPPLDEDSSYLYGWLAGYFAADGSCDVNGQIRISSSNLDNILFVRDVCSILGIGYYAILAENRLSNLTNEEFTMYRIRLMASTLKENFFLLSKHKDNFVKSKEKRFWQVVSVEDTDRYEKVYCATVPETHSFVLEGNILTGNCGFASTEDIDLKYSKAFEFVMDALMLGVGVGFDTKGAGKFKINKPQEGNFDYQIPDSREGWVEALKLVLEAYFLGKQVPIFDFSLIRPAGKPIRGFGGIASGPSPLKEMLEDIQNILEARVGQPITSVDIVDIMNYIGKCVVAGNVRRSAEIALGDPTDLDFVTCKQDQEKLYSHRWASNNSVFAVKGLDYSFIANQIAVNGEPGIFWLENAKTYSRMGDKPDYKDKKAAGVNPCGEQSLESFELCCLVETFPSRHDSYKEFQETLKYAYLYAKSVTLVNTHWQETNAVMLKNRRMGISQTGIIEAFVKYGRRSLLEWCDKGYKYLQELDEQYSGWLCIPKSIKLTTVKPSGTVSLLPGVPPGIHYPHSEYYIRRIRISKNSDLIKPLKNAGYYIEEDSYSPNTIVVEFPVHEKYYSRGKNDVSIWEQAENAAAYQKYWSDNQVSITITFKEEEADQIKYVLECYEDKLKSVSFLPIKEHGYKQAPYEEITKEKYEDIISKVKPLDLDTTKDRAIGEKFCDTEACEVRF